jgi:hypothetical protein
LGRGLERGLDGCVGIDVTRDWDGEWEGCFMEVVLESFIHGVHGSILSCFELVWRSHVKGLESYVERYRGIWKSRY